MVPLRTLYVEYIDRPKLSEQKNPLEYIVPPSPLKLESEQLTPEALLLKEWLGLVWQ